MVKRYDPEVTRLPYASHDSVEMVVYDCGDYVLHSDYEALQRENARAEALQSKLDQTTSKMLDYAVDYDDLKEDNTALLAHLTKIVDITKDIRNNALSLADKTHSRFRTIEIDCDRILKEAEFIQGKNND